MKKDTGYFFISAHGYAKNNRFCKKTQKNKKFSQKIKPMEILMCLKSRKTKKKSIKQKREEIVCGMN